MNRDSALRSFRRHWLIILTTTLVALVISVVATALTPERYVTSVSFFTKTAASEIAGANQGDQFGQRRVTSYVQLFSSQTLADQIVADTGLPITAGEVMAELSATVDPNTVVLTGTVTDASPERSMRIAQSAATQFVQLVSSVETPSGSTTPTVNLQVTSGPSLNPAPVSPRPLLNYGLAVLAGLLLGLILAVLRDRLDTTIRSVDALRDATEIPVLGVVPYDGATKGRRFVEKSHRPSALGESVRQLRVSLGSRFVEPVGSHGRVDARMFGDAGTVVAVASSVGQEGRTSTAANLAASFAEAGQRVVLVDGDLRNPRLADFLGLAPSVGLVDVLTGRIPLANSVHRELRPNLSVLTAGSAGIDPGELVSSRAMVDLLVGLRRSYDLVVVDTPALLGTADASMLAALSDAVLLVVRCGKTAGAQVGSGLALLRTVNAQVLGSVLNRVPVKGVDGYGYQYGRYLQRHLRAAAAAPAPAPAPAPTPTPARSSSAAEITEVLSVDRPLHR